MRRAASGGGTCAGELSRRSHDGRDWSFSDELPAFGECSVLCLQVTTADWERSDKINPTWWRRGLAWWRRGLSLSLVLSLRAWSLCDLDCVNKDLL